jgi:hypothetical protein
VSAVNDDDERTRRAEAAYEAARARYSWAALALGLAHVYDDVREGRPAVEGAQTPVEAA